MFCTTSHILGETCECSAPLSTYSHRHANIMHQTAHIRKSMPIYSEVYLNVLLLLARHTNVWDAVCSKTLRGLSQCFATFSTCVLVAERDLYSHVPANIKVVLNREVDELLRENKYRVVNLALRLYSVHSV